MHSYWFLEILLAFFLQRILPLNVSEYNGVLHARWSSRCSAKYQTYEASFINVAILPQNSSLSGSSGNEPHRDMEEKEGTTRQAGSSETSGSTLEGTGGILEQINRTLEVDGEINGSGEEHSRITLETHDWITLEPSDFLCNVSRLGYFPEINIGIQFDFSALDRSRGIDFSSHFSRIACSLEGNGTQGTKLEVVSVNLLNGVLWSFEDETECSVLFTKETNQNTSVEAYSFNGTPLECSCSEWCFEGNLKINGLRKLGGSNQLGEVSLYSEKVREGSLNGEILIKHPNYTCQVEFLYEFPPAVLKISDCDDKIYKELMPESTSLFLFYFDGGSLASSIIQQNSTTLEKTFCWQPIEKYSQIIPSFLAAFASLLLLFVFLP